MIIEFGAKWESVYDFLLVFNSNLGHILHRYWDTATYLLKITNLSYPLSFSTLLQNDPLRIYEKDLVRETRVFQAADGENLLTLACTIFDWSARDEQTDRQTNRIAMAKMR